MEGAWRSRRPQLLDAISAEMLPAWLDGRTSTHTMGRCRAAKREQAASKSTLLQRAKEIHSTRSQQWNQLQLGHCEASERRWPAHGALGRKGRNELDVAQGEQCKRSALWSFGRLLKRRSIPLELNPSAAAFSLSPDDFRRAVGRAGECPCSIPSPLPPRSYQTSSRRGWV